MTDEFNKLSIEIILIRLLYFLFSVIIVLDMSSLESILKPDAANPIEMEVFNTVSEADQQAWLYFLRSSYKKEQVGIIPTSTFNQFNDGIASFLPGNIPFVDKVIEKGINGQPLISNFSDIYSIPEHNHDIEPVKGAFDHLKERLLSELGKGPVALLVPHPSLATPYAVARSILHTLGEDFGNRLYIVIGPRPTVISYEFYDSSRKERISIPPVLLGRALANLLLTGPDTDSVRNNPELQDWLKSRRRQFWENYEKILEPKDNNENNMVIFCPAGRVAEDGKEYRVDGSFDYITKYPQLSVLPVGVYDRLLLDSENPSSPVFINPDKSFWHPINDNQANEAHERATMLGRSPFGGLDFESFLNQSMRLTAQGIRFKTRKSRSPFLSE